MAPLRGYRARSTTADPQIVPLATEQSDGLMSSEDKAKLDSLTPGPGGFVVIFTAVDRAAALGQLIAADPVGAGITISLPPAAGGGGPVAIKVQYSGINSVTVAPNGGDTIDGQTGSTVMFARQWLWLYSDGISDWMIISRG